MASGNWVQLTVCGHPAEAWEPSAGPFTDAIVFFHDLDGLSPSLREDWRAIVESSSVPVICPLAGRTWWLSVPTAEFPEAGPLGWVQTDVVAWIEQRWGIKPPHFALIGVGMGGNGALNMSYRAARKFPVVAAISAAVDFHVYQPVEPTLNSAFESEEAARQQTAILHLHPLNWPLSQRIVCDAQDRHWLDGCERLASKLSSSGIPFDRDFETTTRGDRNLYDTQQLRISLDYVLKNLPAAVRQLEVV
jgi:pimeloyl-ACP methyl ester carboxylesterase